MSRRRLSTLLGALAALAALAVAVASFAFAATATLKIGTTESATLRKRVATNPQGHTLYELSPETVHHLLCRTATCMRFWPPLTVGSRSTRLKLGNGLHGRLSLLRRTGGTLQVALNGRPLYRYSADHARGQANGEGIVSFGGRWHAVIAAGAVAPAAPPPAPPVYTYPTTPGETTPAAPPPTTTTPTSTTPKPPPYPQY